MRKYILIVFVLILLIHAYACGTKDDANLREVRLIYTQEHDTPYKDLPAEKYDLPDVLLEKLDDFELAYAFLKNPFMTDVFLSSSSYTWPERLNEMKLVKKVLSKEDPMAFFLKYYEEKFSNVKRGDENYEDKVSTIDVLMSFSTRDVFAKKMKSETKEKLERFVKNKAE